MPCTCSPTTRCSEAWDLWEAFQPLRGPLETPDAQRQRRQVQQAYTAHVRGWGGLNGYVEGTKVYPIWEPDAFTDPRQEVPLC